MLKKSFNLLLRTSLWIIGLSFLLGLFLAIAIEFFIFPNINHYKDDIAKKIREKNNLNIEIGEIKAGWKHLEPHLVLSNITLYDQESRPALQLTDTEILVSWLSVPMMDLHLAEIQLKKPALTIRREKSGEIFIAGISIKSKQQKPTLGNWLLRQNTIEIQNANIVWLDAMRNAPPLSLNKLNLTLKTPELSSILDQHYLKLNAVPSVGTQKPIQLESHFYGDDLGQLARWGGVATLTLTDTAIPDFKQWFDYPFQLSSAKGNATLKVTFSNAKATDVYSTLDLNKIKLQLDNTDKALLLDKLSGSASWHPHKNSNRYRLENVNLKQPSLQIDQINATFLQDLNTQHPKHQLSLELGALDLKSIQNLLDVIPLQDKNKQLLAALAPTGNLKELALHWEGNGNKTDQYQINTKFNHLNLKAHEKIPGFIGLSGKIDADEESGSLDLNSQKTMLAVLNVLREPILDNQINGTINWHLKNNQQRIEIESLNIKNPHFAGELEGELLLDQANSRIDLTGLFNDLDLTKAHYYFPKILNEDTLHWLDHAFLAGTGDDIQLTFKGKLNAFPFVDKKGKLDRKKGIFSVRSKIKNAEVHYGKGWPNLKNVNLDMLFEGDSMVLSNSTGTILGNHIDEAIISIPTLNTPEPILMVDGKLSGPVSEGIAFINQSPVLKVTQGFTDGLHTTGDGQLNLKLNIPLKHSIDTVIDGVYQLKNASMASDVMPTLTMINGSLAFTEHALSAKAVQATVFETPTTLDIKTKSDKSIHIDAKGKMTNTMLQHFLRNPGHYLEGSSNVLAKIVIKKPNVDMTIQSDLVGIQAYLPAPLSKNASQPLNFVIKKSQTAQNNLTHIQIGNQLNIGFANNRQSMQHELQYLDIDIHPPADEQNAVPKESAFKKGLNIRGEISTLNIDQWQSVLKDILPADDQDDHLPINAISVKCDALDAFGRQFHQVELSKSSGTNQLIAQVKSKELSGELAWSDVGKGKLTARLSHLMIPEKSAQSTYDNPLFNAVKPENPEIHLEDLYPALNISAEAFSFISRDLGALTLIAAPINNNWQIEKFALSTPANTLTAKGIWENINQNPSTKLDLSWDIHNLGKTLAQFGQPDTVRDGKGTLSGNLYWQGSPSDFNTLALNGDLTFDVGSGEILKIKPGVGRLLGLISLQSLPRRLTLDFRDLFNNGFAFDNIKANVMIQNGIMRSDNFNMSGPAAKVEISGETNLKEETQHLSVTVLPQISDSLSLAALAGGPLAGAVAFLAQKVLKDPLNKIVSTKYEIIGTWDNPKEIKAEMPKQQSQGESGLK